LAGAEWRTNQSWPPLITVTNNQINSQKERYNDEQAVNKTDSMLTQNIMDVNEAREE